MSGRIGGWLASELRPRQVVASLNAALILYLFQVMLALSFVALVFSGDLAAYLPSVVGLVLLGGAILVATVTLFSSYGGSIAVTQDTPSVVLALAAASAVAASTGAAPDDRFATVVLLVMGTTLAMGATFVALGAFRFGALVRYLPYPVLGGFLSGTGWLLVVGGIGVTTDTPVGFGLLEPAEAARSLPGVAFGLLALATIRLSKSSLVLPGLVVLAIVAFHGVAWLRGVPLATLGAEGWLLGPFPERIALEHPLSGDLLARVQWAALAHAAPLAVPAILLGVIALLLNSTSLELVTRRDVRPNRELMVTGAANLAAGAVGGLPGYSAISLSALAYSLAPGRRLPGLVVALLLLLTVAFGAGLLSIVPRLLLGGILAYIGFALLYEWLIRARAFSPPDRAIVVLVFLVIVLTGMLLGVVLGLVLTVLLFVVSFSRVSIVRHELTGATYRSRVSRSLQHTELLRLRGKEMLILQLQSYIFFGTAHQLFEHLRERILEAEEQPLRAVLLDFGHVSGIDATALLSFQKLRQLLGEHGIVLVVTGTSGSLQDRVAADGLGPESPGLHHFPDIDHGVEWMEEQLISREMGEEPPGEALRDQLRGSLPEERRLDRLVDRMERREASAGEVLIRRGDPPDSLFFLESGQLTALLEHPGRDPIRLETMKGGRVVGEIGFFLNIPRSATVVADRPSVVYALTREEWERIIAGDPELASALHRLIVRVLGERVAHLTRVVDELQR